MDAKQKLAQKLNNLVNECMFWRDEASRIGMYDAGSNFIQDKLLAVQEEYNTILDKILSTVPCELLLVLLEEESEDGQ